MAELTTVQEARLEVLMDTAVAQIYDRDADAMVDRDASTVASEKTELLTLLRAKLESGRRMMEREVQRMLRLERE